MLTQFKQRIAEWLGWTRLAPKPEPRRQVTPRPNVFALRRKLLRDIHRQLREAGLLSARPPRSTSQ